MLLRELAEISQSVGATPSRLEKVERLARALRRMSPEEVPAGVAFLCGELRQRQIGVGWASLRGLAHGAVGSTLTLGEVDAAFARIGGMSGPGSQASRRAELAALFGRAAAAEHAFLCGVLLGDVRQGALEGVMTDAVARAAQVAVADVRRALMLSGSLPAVAAIALGEGAAGLDAVGLEVGRPVKPMLAQPAVDLRDALGRLGTAAIEWKLDGARIQVHRRDADVRVFTRSLDDITARVPEVVEMALTLPADAVVLDAEAIVLRDDGRPQPFQITGGRLGSSAAVTELRRSLPLVPFVFDLLHLDGQDLIDRPAAERFGVLETLVPARWRVPRATVADLAAAEAFLAGALEHGQEGVVLKSLSAPYAAGRRGGGWLKIKPVHTLDLVVLAAEWGHGRRRGWLSNLHLGARDPAGGGFVMLGKTFKGMTDEMLASQTQRLLELEVGRDAGTVHVRPELVVEVAFDGLQASSRYPGGVTLRFARILRHRPDKAPSEADTLDAVLAFREAAREPLD
jgi:DNA ligase-1